VLSLFPSASPSTAVSQVQAGSSWWTPSLFISILALLFTVGSFFWIQVRRGRLRSYTPFAYAAAFTAQKLVIVLPVVLHNPGPAPIVVLDLRLRIWKTDEQFGNGVPSDAEDVPDERSLLPLYLPWDAEQLRLEPAGTGEPDARWRPSPIPVEGRRANRHFIEFQRENSPLLLIAGPYTATVEVKLAHRPHWHDLLTFPLNTQLSAGQGRHQFLTRTNDPQRLA